jgi:uncharacterized membrane protein YtjA (UPF0391 family)
VVTGDATDSTHVDGERSDRRARATRRRAGDETTNRAVWNGRERVAGGRPMSPAAVDLVPLQFSGGFLGWAVAFFVVAVIAGIAGFRGIAGLTMGIAKILVVVFLVLAVVSLLL